MSKLIRKMLSAAGGPLRTTPAMTTKNVTNAANKLGEWFLQGLGVVGKFITAPVTLSVPTTATTAATTYQTKKLIDRKRLIDLQSEELLGKAMTWVSPLNYGAALYNGHGLNAYKGEQEVAQWSPFWQAVGRGTELYLGPKVVKGVKKVPAIMDKGLAKAGNTSAKGRVVAREINKNIQNSELLVPLRYITKNYTTNDKGNVSTVSYQLIDPIFGQPLGNAVISGRLINNGKGRPVGWIESLNKAKGVSEDIYNTAVLDALLLGELGIESGWDLMEPKKTLAVTKKFPHEVIGESEGHPVRLLTGVTNKQKPLTIDFSNHILFLNDNIKFNLATGQFEEIKPIIDGNKLSLKFFERKPARINEAERAGVPKGERNFTPRLHVANYPGYQLKGLMKGSPLERLLSKNGTININSLMAQVNKASEVEKAVINKVLEEKFNGLKVIDYNALKKAVLEELITYSRKPLTRYNDYGIDRIGFKKDIIPSEATVGDLENMYPGRFQTVTRPLFKMVDTETGRIVTNNAELLELVKALNNEKPYKLNTFTFESPRITNGSGKHYDATSLGHSRTFTLKDDPKKLYVLESLSDWGQTKVKMLPSALAMLIAIDRAIKSGNTNAFHGFTNKLHSILRNNLTKYEQMALDNINAEIESRRPSGFLTIDELWNKKYEILKKASKRTNLEEQGLHLHDNYLQRQLQENLKFAAENGLTTVSYATPETAAKIEGYLKTINPKYLELLNKLSELQMRLNELLNLEALSKMFNEPFSVKDNLAETYKVREELNSTLDLILQIRSNGIEKTYAPEHQTILKKYADFPKLFNKLYKGLQVRIVTDTKGNTWYEVDVPKGYLNREWQFKQGGKINGDSK